MTVTTSSSIQSTHDDAAWSLDAGEAMRLPIGPGRRELRVLEGRIWITQQGLPDMPSHDYWLQSGEALDLPSGAELVVEAWPTARFQLLVPPQACREQQAAARHRFNPFASPSGLATA